MNSAVAQCYRLVVFDFDGTLADSFPWFCSVLNEVAARYRFRQVGDDEIEALRGMGAGAIVRHLGIPAWKLPLVTRHMTTLAARDIAGIRLFPGIAPMLGQLAHSGVPLAIVSSNAEPNIRAVLGPELAGGIGRYACGASLFGKARRLKAVIRNAGVTGAATLYVGDEIRDHEAASAAGCDFAAVAWGYTRPETLAGLGPAFCFSEPADILTALAPHLKVARAPASAAP